MPRMPKAPPPPSPSQRAVIEVCSIVFLFYANLLMGEFTGSSRTGKTLAFALHDIVTRKTLAIAIVSALLGYLIFEYLRKNITPP